jgi:hypothetical protein
MNKVIDPDSSEDLIEELSHKLYTLCSVMNEKPFIQYQVESVIAERVALNVHKKLEFLYNYSSG